MTEAETLIATMSAAVAAVAALAALATLIVSTFGLMEARKTITELRALLEATRAGVKAQETVLESLRSLAVESRSTVGVLHMILAEAQAARELEHLRAVAAYVGDVRALFGRFLRAGGEADGVHKQQNLWPQIDSAKRLLGSLLAGVPSDQLAECRRLAEGDPRNIDALPENASSEVRKAISDAIERLSAATAAAQAALGQMPTSART